MKVHFSKEIRHHLRSFKQNSALNHSEDVENLSNLYRMATKVAAIESSASVQFDLIIDLLIDFLKTHKMNDFVREEALELVKNFQQAIQIKTKVFQRLKRMLLMIRVSKTISNGKIDRMHEQLDCLQRFTSCMDLSVVAKKLAASKVCIFI